jgi:hypothetical protein
MKSKGGFIPSIAIALWWGRIEARRRERPTWRGMARLGAAGRGLAWHGWGRDGRASVIGALPRSSAIRKGDRAARCEPPCRAEVCGFRFWGGCYRVMCRTASKLTAMMR